MKKNALVLFSGGKDSFYTTLLILEKGYNVKLLTYENGCGLKSELDDIPGLGKVKKQELLRKFGSVDGIRKASEEELMKVKGINEELAKTIKRNLYE